MKPIKANFSIRFVATMVALLSLTAGVFAQGQQDQGGSTKGAVIKGRAPVNKQLLRVKLPKAQEATLKNGLRVVLLPSNRVPTFSMEMVVMTGGLADPADMRGLASTTATMLREGTAKHNSREIAEALDGLGATYNASSGVSSFLSSVSVSGMTENLDAVLDLFAEIVRTPKFPTEELDRYKSRTLASQPLLRTQPGFLASERLNQAIYQNHPASLVITPPESIKKMTSADLAKFHAANYVPNNAMLAIVGDVTLKDIMPKLERAFGDWKTGTPTPTTIPAVPAQSASRIFLINRPGSVQTVFQIGSLGVERTNPDYIAMALMNRILGGGVSSRLFLNIREDKSYAYSVGSSFNTSKYRGTFIAQAPVRTEATEGAMREFMNEFKRIRDEQVTATELENAKRAFIGNFARSLETPSSLLDNIIAQKIYNLPANYWDTYIQKVEATTAADIQRVAQKYIDLQHLQIVAVGDASKAREVLAKFGTVEEYDAEGKPVKTAAAQPGQ